jgi:hypothetical protein
MKNSIYTSVAFITYLFYCFTANAQHSELFDVQPMGMKEVYKKAGVQVVTTVIY